MVTRPAIQTTRPHRETVLARESHRQDLLDPATLRWVASLLTELDGMPTRTFASHLVDIAETAGSAIEVCWHPNPTKLTGANRRPGATPTESKTQSSW
jgi:hypothetical protein